MRTWKPDTCDCKVEEIYDETFDPNADGFTWVIDPINGVIPVVKKGKWIVNGISGGMVLKKCNAHKDVADEDLYDVIRYQENAVKNQVYNILLGYDEIKDLGLEELKTNEDGLPGGLGLKKGVEYAWSFTGNGKGRVLKFNVRGARLTAAKKTAIRDLCDKKFGAGKVEIK